MKFIFLKSGDYLEFEPKRTPFVDGWFNFLFDTKINSLYVNDQRPYRWTNVARLHIEKLNSCIEMCNKFIKETIPTNDIFLQHSEHFSQGWLNDSHKKWVYLTDLYKNQIYDVPDEIKVAWSDINEYIHKLETSYVQDFQNTYLDYLPRSAGLKVTKDDCEYFQHGLVVSYNNLGRHQFNQWEVGTNIDGETNNYDIVSTGFTYFNSPAHYSGPPPAYVSWCKEQNLEVLPPWIILGDFKNSNRFYVRELMHRNLLQGPDIGFEL